MDVVDSFPFLNFGNSLSTYYKGKFCMSIPPPSYPKKKIPLKIILPKEAGIGWVPYTQ